MFETIEFIVRVIPLIIDLVKHIEEIVPEGGKGKEKLEFVRESLESADDIADEVKSRWPLIKRLVGAVVTFMNKIGGFSKK